jgi:hypothetical protein
MHAKGYVSDSQLAEERSKLEAARIEQAEERLRQLEEEKKKGQSSDDQVEHARNTLRDLETARGEIALARSDLARAIDRLDWAERMLAKGFVTKAQVESERRNRKRAEFALEQAVGKREAVAEFRDKAGKSVPLQGVLRGKVTELPAASRATVTLSGVVRDRATSRPVSRVQVSEPSTSTVATVDEAGRFTLAGLPERAKYTLVALPIAGQPYLITSTVAERVAGKDPGLVEIGLVRGIPFRIKVVDPATRKSIPGTLSYFPVSPNNPFRRGVMGYSAGGRSLGAFYEAVPDGHTGEFYGAVLPGPGVLCFRRADGKGRPKRGNLEPLMLFPDGKGAITLARDTSGKTIPSALVVIGDDPKPLYGLLDLRQYDAVIAISPEEGTEQITHEVKQPR